QKAAMIENYNTTVPSFITKAAADYNKAYYENTISSVKSVTELTADKRLFSYVKTAFGLSATMSATEFKLIMASDLDNPRSYANIVGAGAVVKAFNFSEDGTLPDGALPQNAEMIEKTSTQYFAKYDVARTDTIDEAAQNFQKRMQSVKDLNDFLVSTKNDSNPWNNKLPELYQVALRAYGIDNDEVSTAQLRKILTSDPYDKESYVSSLKDKRFVDLAKAFNFDEKGKAGTPVEALSDAQVGRYISDYKARSTIGLSGAKLDRAVKDVKEEALYFSAQMVKVKTASDFLGDSRMVNFVLVASGIDPKTMDSATLKKAFASDASDPQSFVNTQPSQKLRDIVSAFNFDKDGNLTRDKMGAVQTEGATLKVEDLYLRQTLEQQQGETNDGVRLALYFQRKASDVTSIYGLMADRALFEVITTTFSLPSAISNMDVDKQAAMLGRFVKVEDLQDEAKVNKLLKRFAAMYDIKNNQTSSAGLSILQGSSSSGISADTLLSIAQLRTR
ncbi:MAG: DUF1217 domain-containing protein, partial [Rhizobiaceae bacterium]|nr:DUF1217 domain-containing protein [Rhizobiaceae bacterium]